MSYAAFAFLYVVGLSGFFPRTGWHDAMLSTSFCLSFVAGASWDAVRKIPYVGMAIYYHGKYKPHKS